MQAPKKQQTATKNTTSAKRVARSASAQPGGNSAKRPLFDSRVRSDLAGVALIIFAVVLFVIVLMPGDAAGSQLTSQGIHLLVGAGAVILPFLFVAWAATFFIRQRLTTKPLRLIIGLSAIYLAIVALSAAFLSGVAAEPNTLFSTPKLIAGGGYLGSALAWLLLTVFGLLPTTIILLGLILAGLVLVGFSISRIVENFGGRVARRRQAQAEADAELNAAATAGAYQMGAPAVLAAGKGKTKQGAPIGQGGVAALAPTRLAKGTGELNGDQLFDGAFDKGEQGVLPLDTTADLGATRRRRRENGNKVPAEQTETKDPELTLLNVNKTANKARSKSESAVNTASEDNQTAQFRLPDPKILQVSKEKATTKAGAAELRSTAARLQATFEEFGVEGQVIGWISGPTVTLFKVSLGEGVRLNRITNLQNDIQLALAAIAIRIVAPIPGTSLVGIEIPNGARNTVLLGDVLFNAQPGSLQLAIGKDVEGDSITADLSSMPHLLIGGSTGSGKSVAINAMIMSILMRATPEEVRMILIDPKMVELSLYNGIPHLYVPVVTDAHQAAGALNWAVAEMERRLRVFGKHGVKNIKQFNQRVNQELLNNAHAKEQALQKATDDSQLAAEQGAKQGDLANHVDTNAETEIFARANEASGSTKPDPAVEQENLRAVMPYIVIVIDELADLMMVAGKDVETSISRLAQLARAAGLHLIVATQRPSSTVITGLIKANIVNRIAFTVATGIDSRVILDVNGAEDLIGLGDLLFSRPEYSKPSRIQGCLVSESEIEETVEYLRSQGEPDYHQGILETRSSNTSGSSSDESFGEDDPLLWEAAEIVVNTGLGSTSTLQRRLKVGYARAGRIMDMLEAKGIVGPPNGSKPREVIIDDVLDLETLKAFER